MEIFAVVIFIVFCSALCHLVHAFYNRSDLRLFFCLCWLQFVKLSKINLLKFYDLKPKGNGSY